MVKKQLDTLGPAVAASAPGEQAPGQEVGPGQLELESTKAVWKEQPNDLLQPTAGARLH
jgi:hypothetical protein